MLDRICLSFVFAMIFLFAMAALDWNAGSPQSVRSQNSVRYLSDEAGSGYAWLEEQQRKAYGDTAHPTSIEDLQTALDRLPVRKGWEDSKSLMQAIKIGDLKLPTRYEDIGSFFLTNSLSEDIRAAASKQAGREIQKILWGTLPIPEVNASAQKVGTDYIVVLNQHLFMFLYSLLLIVDRTVAIEAHGNQVRLGYSEADFQRAVQKSPRLVNDFASHIVAFAKGTHLPGLPFANEMEAPVVIKQLNSIERFIVGHEFGHVLAGHTDHGLRFMNLPQATGGTFRLPSLGRDWTQELEADELGQRLAKAARLKDESGESEDIPLLFEALAAYAPVLFFELADALDDVLFCEGTGEGSSRTIGDSLQDRIFRDVSRQLSEKKVIAPSNIDAAALGCRQHSHPPAWLRRRFAEVRVDVGFVKPLSSQSAEVQFAKALISNARTLAALSAPEIRRRLAQ